MEYLNTPFEVKKQMAIESVFNKFDEDGSGELSI
jgi:hypothetical protein